MPRKIVLLGGTKGIGRALARRLVDRGDRLHLLGRDLDDLARSAADLQVRGVASTGPLVSSSFCDLERPDSFAPAIAAAAEAMGGFDTVIVTAALFATQDRLEGDPDFLRRLLAVNFSHTVLFCELVRGYLLANGGGTLCVFSSVAGDRGRKPIVLYGAAKAGLSAYLEGLDHRYRTRGLTTICVKPGFVRTGMTDGLPEPPFAADADRVAVATIRAIERGAPVVYVPAVWAVVMGVVKRLPRAVMRRVGF